MTHYFPPEAGAPQTRIELLARTLAARGFEVTVHTCFPHYPSGAVLAPYRNRPWLRESRDGVTVIRSAVYPAPNSGFARRLLDHTSFAASSLVTAPLAGPLDVLVAETPPLFTAASGALYAALKRSALVVNVADRWPASAVQLGALRNRTAIAAATRLERWIYARADAITMPTEGIAAMLELVPEATGKCRRLWPVVDTDRFAAVDPVSSSGPRAPLRVLYAGTVGMAHGVETLVKASRIAGPDVVQTTIAGAGAELETVRGAVAEAGATNVAVLGLVRPDEVPSLYADSDAAVVLLRDLPVFRGALPTKLCEAMAAGRPVLLSAEGESADAVRGAEAGIVVPPGDPAALADAIRRLHSDRALGATLGASGRVFAEARLGADRAADAWAGVLREAAAIARASAGRSGRAAGARRPWD